MGADAFAAGDADRRQQKIGKRHHCLAQRYRTACLKEISTPPIAMDAMIEPGAGRAEEARNE